MFIDTQIRPQGEVQQEVGKLKLSDAIRIGAKLRPKCTGKAFWNGASCALGAAYEARFKEVTRWEDFPTSKIVREFGVPYQLMTEAAIHNDSGWTREQVADWLEDKGY